MHAVGTEGHFGGTTAWLINKALLDFRRWLGGTYSSGLGARGVTSRAEGPRG